MSRQLPAVLDHFNIRSWDLLLVGDGSGQGWDMGCGWSVAIVDKATMTRKLLWGAWSLGTVGVGELIPYLHALMYYHAKIGKELRKQAFRKGRLLEVHVLSDNETVVRQGQREMERNANAPLWMAIDQCLREGYQASWHWIARDTVGLHQLTDHVSRCARLAIQELTLAKMVPDMPGISVYDLNPG